MAIEAGWDPDTGLPLPAPPSWDEDPDEPAFELPDDETVAWWAELDAAADGPMDDEPGWAVPGVSDAAPPEEGLSARSRAELAELADAVRAQRLAGARVYRAFTAVRAGDVLAESGYRKLSPLLEDHVRLDRTTVTKLDRHAEALHDTVTPTGSTTPASLPATAAAVDEGTVDADHVEVIAKVMDRLRRVPVLDESTLAVAEEQLAGLAGTHSPKRLYAAAKVIADRLDPDGAAPKDDHPAGNELHYTKRRDGHLHAKLVLRDPAGVALFDDAIRAATPPPASAAVADPDTGEAPTGPDGERGQCPDDEARDTKPARQACGLLDLLAASHRAGLDHTEDEQAPGSPTASMPLPDLDNEDDTAAPWATDADLPGNGTPEGPADHDEEGPTADLADAEDTASATEEPPRFGPGPPDESDDRTDSHREAGDTGSDTGSDTGEPPPDPGAAAPPPGPPPHTPWSPPDPASMALPGRERVTLTVTLDYKTLRQQLTDTSTALALLGDSTFIRPDTARRLACDADIIPIVLGSKGEVLDVGRKTRSIPTATGRAVTVRDRHCAFPGCRRRARTAQIHHIQHWAHDGDTEPDNLVCLCRYHHDLVHHSGWEVIMVDHMPWFRPPHWLDPTRTLRHNRPWTLA
ncbi:HNH endonuclease signature motif containing protein [Actinomycetospora sp. NBRC 106378]|uniref:HNH endonuclease signature motif containing protein n=1 Tax=Actinomycetospora sp. NBRC 106378 TaxID=3032208 RepID=UPI0024A14C77|nr:HNH endonuclease signature motif containing protein [Actinomycetospora sp. NBRC 106378]GLZ51529.1 hypothetical protein Acsp07_11460 [Actinomycetospora sp. NBRC 106378]